MAMWPSGLRRRIKAPVRKGVGSNPTIVMISSEVMVHICSGYYGGPPVLRIQSGELTFLQELMEDLQFYELTFCRILWGTSSATNSERRIDLFAGIDGGPPVLRTHILQDIMGDLQCYEFRAEN